MEKSVSVVVWSKQGCSYCAEVKDYLDGKGIEYREVDVTHHDERRDILETKYGVRYVPVVEIGQGNVYEGVIELGIDHLEKALERANA